MAHWAIGKFEGVVAVFCIPKLRGRVYIETSDTLQAFELLKNCVLVYWSNMYLVGEEERVELLSPHRIQKNIKVNDLVRIRSGLFRQDIAQVVKVESNAEFYHVIAIPRLRPPVPVRRLTKRPRLEKNRPLRQRLREADAIRKYGSRSVRKLERDEDEDEDEYEDEEDFNKGDFEFKKNRYNEGGLRYLRFRHDAIDATRPTLEDIHPFLDAAMEKIIKYREDPEMLDDGSMWMTRHTDDEVFDVANIKLEQLALENFLSKGSEVEVMEGEQIGMTGRVVSVSTKGTITIAETNSNLLVNGSPMLVEIQVRTVRPIFKIGDSVSVKSGVFAGRSGCIEEINGSVAFVREQVTREQVIKIMYKTVRY